MKTAIVTVAFIAGVLALGTVMGSQFPPGDWYASLNKPFFNPPSWIFAPVWTALYVLIGWAGSRTWMRDAGGSSFKIWLLQMALNVMWTPVFFGAHRAGMALLILGLLWGSVLAFIWTVYRTDLLSALLFLPYFLWVSFAGMLNAALCILNRA